MKPLSLTMRAFGPFPREESIDFTAMGRQPFFLIHGPTGAGKTSILDAICFALYGDASGSARDPKFMRAKGAAPDAVCEVEFLFDIGGKQYHVRRQPSQILGAGNREKKHEVEFSRVDSHGNVIGDRLRKVGDVAVKVERLLGFTSEQFRQVVILPQGEFRNLLHADSAKKESVLKQLFGTRLYERVEEILKERRLEIKRQLEDLALGQRGLLSAYLKDVEEPTVEMLEEQTKEYEKRQVNALKARDAKRIERKAADEALTAGRAIETLFLQREAAEAETKAMLARRDEVEKRKRRVEAARKAQGLVDLEQKVLERRGDLEEAQGEMVGLEKAVANQRRGLKQLEPRVAALKKKKAKVGEWTRKLAKLEERLSLVEDVDTHEREATQSAAMTERLKTIAGEAKSKLEAAMTRRHELGKALKRLSKELAVELSGDPEVAKVRLQTRIALDKDAAAIMVVSRESEILVGEVERLKAQTRDAQAAILAISLVTGQPCPVCGSRDHPHPTGQNEGACTSTIEKALEALEDTQKRLDAKNEEKSRLKERVRIAQKQLGADASRPIAEFRAQVEALVATLVKRQQTIKEAERRQSEVERLDKDLLTLNKASRAASEEAAGETSRAKTLAKKAKDLKIKLGKGEADPDALQEQINVLQEQIDEVSSTGPKLETEHRKAADALKSIEGELKKVSESVKRLSSEVSRVTGDLGARLAKAGFGSLKAFQAAKLGDRELERLSKDVDGYDKSVQVASGRLKAAAEECKGKKRPDISVLKARFAALEREANAHEREIASLGTQVKDRRKALNSLAKDAEASRKLDADYRRIGHLADVTQGNNSQRVSLQRYVLASLLDNVVIRASDRLQKMSRGRYRLERETLAIDGRKGAGLDLRVLDEFSGETRPVKTLSGGETFLASLALALGLADVVISGSHGRYLETLFIDEGFGSLDSETLETAMNTLVALHKSGRMIGIISHVPDLKDRIQNRIELVQNRDSSRIKIVSDNFLS